MHHLCNQQNRAVQGEKVIDVSSLIYCKNLKEFQLLEEDLKKRGYTYHIDGVERIREQMGLSPINKDRANHKGVIIAILHNLKIYSILRYGA